MSYTSYNEDHNLFDDDLTCAEWIEGVAKRVSWKTFERQEDMVYMAGEIADRPMTKSGCLEVAREIVEGELSWLVQAMAYGVVDDLYRLSDVDVDEETAQDYNEFMGYDEGDPRAIRPVRRDPKSEVE